jgi:DNA-binding transcriptional ArsR family regulator
MALAHLLAEAGHAPRWIETRARVHLRLVDGQAEVAVEVASAARNPVDAPAHPLPVSSPVSHVISKMANDTFKALAHPLRRDIVERLSSGMATVGEATRDLGVSKPTISRHLKLLEEAGVVSRVVDGRTHRLALRPEALAEAEDWIERQRERWERLFDAVGEYLEERKERQ